MSGARAWVTAKWLLLLACLATLGWLTALLTWPGANHTHLGRTELVSAAWVAFGVAAWLVRKVSLKRAAGLILVAGIGLQAVAFSAPPAHSTDMYRYMWDGQVQASGIDPYEYPPSAAGVAQVRNDFIWHPYTSNAGHSTYHYCVVNKVSPEGPSYDQVAGCAKINRTNSPTIYPPVAEAWFTLVYLVAGDNSTTPMQVAMALCAVLTTLVLLFGLRRLGRDPRLAALWAWCPTAILEVGNDAHADVLGVLLTAIGLLVLASARTKRGTVLGGVLLGLALATKLTPIFTFPGVLKRGWRLILGAALATTIAVYVPHVIAVGSKVIGFFPGYLQQQGYASGSGYAIIGLFLHGKHASAAAFLIMGVVAVAVLRYSDPDQPWRGAVVMTAVALAVGTPEFEWYSMLIVVLVALDGRAEWLAMSAGAYLANEGRLTATITVPHQLVAGYGGGLVVALAISAIRYRHALAHYRPLTRTALAGRGTPRQPSIEVCDTRIPLTRSVTRSVRPGITRTRPWFNSSTVVSSTENSSPANSSAATSRPMDSSVNSTTMDSRDAAETLTPAWTSSAQPTMPPSTASSTE